MSPGRARERLWLAAVAILALALRGGLACRELEVVDRLFVPDDTYYTLSIARSLAAGLGPTADGHTITSGFQPLVGFLLVPVFLLTDDLDVPLRCALWLGVLCDVGVVLALGAVGRRLAGAGVGLTAASLWALSPLAVANALGGLETSLALLLQLLAVLAWTRGPGWGAGLIAGLALLARIDAAPLVVLLGLWGLRSLGFREVVRRAAIASLVVAPWWGYCILRLGSAVPESGAAVRDIVLYHQALYLEVPLQFAWSVGTVLSTPLGTGAYLRTLLASHPALATAGFVALLAVPGALAVGAWRRGEGALAAFGLHALFLLCFYTLYLPALWFFGRYLAPVELSCVLLLAFALGRLGPRLRRVGLAALMGLAAVTGVPLLWVLPTGSADAGLHGAKGYRGAARDVYALLPPGAVVGAYQSGALSYFAPPGMQVVNLDGVVDHEAHRAAREGRLATWAVENRQMTHIADWGFNLRALEHQTTGALPPVRVLGQARPQGTDFFTVLEVEQSP